ncbi:MAG: family 10 glycosylhydrolase, partial [Cyanobacteria bacterium REEB65]|nr:family 10 glycosylhydrolase [Cyanobacteria bacterium REEB65]
DRYPDTDLLSMYVNEAHRRGMKVHAWLHTLNFGPQWAKSHPDTLVRDGFGELSGAVEPGSDTVSPALPEVRVELDRIVDELASHSVDGVMLDYLRYPVRMKGDDIDETPDPRNFFGYNARQLAQIEEREPDMDTAEYRSFLQSGKATFYESQQLFLNRFKQAMTEDLTGLIDEVKRNVRGRMLLDAAYFPDYYFHTNDTRVQDSRVWADRFDLLSPMCYEYYLDDYPAPYGTYTVNRALTIADDTVQHLPPGTATPILLPSLCAEVPGTPMEAPLHHVTLREQTAFVKGMVFDRAYPHVSGVAYFSYGWIYPDTEAERKAGG